MVSRYQSLSLGSQITESQLKGQLAEYLNAEIVLLTVSSVGMALDWLKQSFLYVRVSFCCLDINLPSLASNPYHQSPNEEMHVAILQAWQAP